MAVDPGILASARQLAHAANLSLDDATTALQALYADGYVTGAQAAVGMLGSEPDWSTWQPGYGEAALQAWGQDGGRGLQAMLEQAGVTIRSVAENKMDDLAEVLGQALDEGWGVGELAGALKDVMDDPSRAEMVARTESARAMTTAAHDEYQQAGVTGHEQLLSDGACQECIENADAGVIPLDQDFPNGAPPTHPNCTCAEAPAYIEGDISTTEGEPEDMMAG